MDPMHGYYLVSSLDPVREFVVFSDLIRDPTLEPLDPAMDSVTVLSVHPPLDPLEDLMVAGQFDQLGIQSRFQQIS